MNEEDEPVGWRQRVDRWWPWKPNKLLEEIDVDKHGETIYHILAEVAWSRGQTVEEMLERWDRHVQD